MSYIFLALFLAAVVGIFKPYKGLKRSHFAIAAVICFVLIGVFAPTPVPNEKKASVAATGGSKDDATQSVAVTDESKWDYSQSKDEMRGTTARFASVDSDNVVDLQFPYGETHGQLWIRQRPEDGLNVAFEVEKGQVLCHSYSDDYISMKFDDGPIQKFRCTGSSDGSTETAFITDERRALAALKHSKRTVVEAEFFQQGRQQFVFDTAGLKWE